MFLHPLFQVASRTYVDAPEKMDPGMEDSVDSRKEPLLPLLFSLHSPADIVFSGGSSIRKCFSRGIWFCFVLHELRKDLKKGPNCFSPCQAWRPKIPKARRNTTQRRLL